MARTHQGQEVGTAARRRPLREQGQFGSCHILVSGDSVPRQSLFPHSLFLSSSRLQKRIPFGMDEWTDERTNERMDGHGTASRHPASARCVKEKYNLRRRGRGASLAPLSRERVSSSRHLSLFHFFSLALFLRFLFLSAHSVCLLCPAIRLCTFRCVRLLPDSVATLPGFNVCCAILVIEERVTKAFLMIGNKDNTD